MKGKYSDEELIAFILSGGRELEKGMSYIYKNGTYFSAVRALVMKFGGKLSDVEDLFQDGIAHLIMNIRKGNFRAESNIKTYFLTICKNLWFQKRRRENIFKEIKQKLPDKEKSDHTPESILLFKEKVNILDKALKILGSPCQEIITLWSLNYSMKEIAQQTNYKNAAVARKKKHQCLQNLIKWVKGNTAIVESLSRN